MKALILAAGYSTRLYPLTLNTPKALLPIGKKAMIDYLIEKIAALGAVKETIFVTNARFYKDFSDWAEGANERYAPMRFTVVSDGTSDDAGKLGAVGDIAYAVREAKIDDDLLVAASDNFFEFSLDGFLSEFKKTGRDTLLGARIKSLTDLRRFAVATLDETGRVTNLVEKPENPQSDIAVYALYLYRRDTLPLFESYLKEGNSPDAPGHFPEWLYPQKPVGCHIAEGEIIDIGTPASYHDVCARFGGA